ncbi:hypothetical protein ABLE92_20655 [Gordonia sp. VNQ95]|uniref:hypothetical protein n=1 Tax=Gordonia TaxID=2053 RepID=UPI0032B52B5C
MRIILWSLCLLAVALIHTAIRVPAATAGGQLADLSTARNSPAATSAVDALVGPDPAQTLRYLPPDFARVIGYRPLLADGYPVNPTGRCSSPVPLPSRFEPLCKTHDFGYDLLRYSARAGAPLPPSARLAIDRMLIDRMRADCTGTPCAAAAEASRIGLAVNTWRQNGEAPVSRESLSHIVMTTLWKAVAGNLGVIGGER